MEGDTQVLSGKHIRKLGLNEVAYTRSPQGIFLHIPNLQLGEGAEKTIHLAVHATTGEIVAHGILKGGKTEQELVGDRAVMDSKCDPKHVAVPIDVTHINAGDAEVPASRHSVMMPYCDGGVLEHQTLRGEGLAKAGHEMALGLKAMHEKGLYHRDLKPANIMLHEGAIKLVDFGCVKGNAELKSVYKLKGKFFDDVSQAMAAQEHLNSTHDEIKQVHETLKGLLEELKHPQLDAADYRGTLVKLLDALSTYIEALKQSPNPKLALLEKLKLTVEGCFIVNVRGGGSRPYLAPEVSSTTLTPLERDDPSRANAARDVYAFGATLWALL